MQGVAPERALLFTLGSRTLSLPSARTRQVIPLDRITPVPRASSALLGLVTVRGDIVPLVDLGQLLDIPGDPLAGRSRAIVTDAHGQLFAFPVDEILGFERTDTEPKSTAAGVLLSEAVTLGDHAAAALDPDVAHQALSQAIQLT